MEITEAEQEKKKKDEDSLRDLWDNIKHTNTHIMRAWKRRKKERGREHIWRHNTWKLP